MPVSPRDFELYSRMTGTPMPMDAQQRMKMAPEVFQFSRNFAKKPNILEKTGNLVKNIGKTVGMGLAVAAASPSFVEQRETTADQQKQDITPSQTAEKTEERKVIQKVEIENNKTVAKDVVDDQNFKPAFDATPKKSEEQILSEMKQYEEQAGLNRIGGPADVSGKVEEFLKQGKINPVLLAAMQKRGQEEELVGTSFPIASQLTDNPQIALDGGQSTRSQSREFIKETEPIGGIPTNVDPSTLTPEVKNVLDTLAKGVSNMPIEQRIKVAKEMVEEKNMMDSPNETVGKLTAEIDKKEKANQNLLDFVKTLGGEPTQEQKIEADQANSRILQKTAAKNRKKGNVNEKFYPTDVARTDIQVGGMKDRKTGLGRSVGISYTPLNGDTKVGFNMMSDPTKPKDVKTYEFTASPEAMQSLQSQEEGELGSETFGKLFNIAKRKQQGFSGLEM